MIDRIISDAFCLEAVRTAADATFKSSLLVAFAWTVAFALRRGPAQLRSQVWTFTLVGLAAIPLLSLATPLWRWPLLPDFLDLGALLRGAGDVAATGPTIPPAADPTAPAASGPIAGGSAGTHWTRWGLGLLTAGAGVQLLWIALSRWSLQRVIRGAVPVDASWRPMVEAARSRLGLQRRVRVMKSASVMAGITVGSFRPLVVLPAVAEGWPLKRRQFTVSHEFAHVKRWDALIEDLGILVTVLHWFNPLVRMALRQLRIEREKDCDNRVLLAGAQPSDYAQQLLEIAADLEVGDRPAWRAAQLSQGSHLKDRLLHILNPGAARRASGRTTVALSGAIVLAAALPLASMNPWPDQSIASAVADVLLPAESQKYYQGVKDPEHSAALIAEKIHAVHGGQRALAFLERTLLEGGSDGDYRIREDEINALGYRLLNSKRGEEALAVFRFNVEAFPEAWNVHDSLGEAYLTLGDLERAAASYKTSLTLGSKNVDGAREALDFIQRQLRGASPSTS